MTFLFAFVCFLLLSGGSQPAHQPPTLGQLVLVLLILVVIISPLCLSLCW
eukprot:m.685756 g.685756  ORF g.685756 m.685756 type:complete len:50 (-) comp58626_c0_seq3:1172-1321(-)